MMGDCLYLATGNFPVLSNQETDYRLKHECFVTFEWCRSATVDNVEELAAMARRGT